MKHKLTTIEKKSDSRGYLVEFLKNGELPRKHKEFGQIYYVNFSKKGIIRGNHYHKKKNEYFGLVFGKVRIDIEDIRTKEKKSFIFDADKEEFIRLSISPHVAHAVISLSNYAILIDYFTSEYLSDNPDTFIYKVI